jgi:beta-galactosidase
MAAEPPLCRADGSADPRSYGRIVQAFARGLVDAGRQLAVVNERQLPDAAALVERYPTVVVPGLVAASDRTLSVLVEYVRLGGTLIVGPRTGFGDDSGRVRSTVAPGVLASVLGASYAEFASLRDDVPIDGFGGGVAQGWIDSYEPDVADVLARYAHPHYGAWAVVTRNAFGAGTAFAVGTLPDRRLMARIVAEASSTRVASPVRDRPASVTAHSLSGPSGRVWVIHNWSPDAVEVTTAKDVVDVLAGEAPLPAGSAQLLAPWGVAVWGEARS